MAVIRYRFVLPPMAFTKMVLNTSPKGVLLIIAIAKLIPAQNRTREELMLERNCLGFATFKKYITTKTA